ncbi:MAG: dihydrofolate reductase family protein [Acidimicrobiales bacterium]
MREIHPGASNAVDVLGVYAADERSPHDDGLPWLVLGMVATADGATTLDGGSGALGGEADRTVFAAIRAVPDVILVAAATVRAEGYGPPRPAETVRSAREARGQAPAPRLAVITASLDLDPSARLFAEAEPENRPFVITAAGGEPERLASLAAVAEEVIVVGTGRVELRAALAQLAARGSRIVLCEGGPSLNGQLIAADLVDELCLTVPPMLASGESARVAHGPAPPAPTGLRLARVLEHQGALCLRYVRA